MSEGDDAVGTEPMTQEQIRRLNDVYTMHKIVFLNSIGGAGASAVMAAKDKMEHEGWFPLSAVEVEVGCKRATLTKAINKGKVRSVEIKIKGKRKNGESYVIHHVLASMQDALKYVPRKPGADGYVVPDEKTEREKRTDPRPLPEGYLSDEELEKLTDRINMDIETAVRRKVGDNATPEEWIEALKRSKADFFGRLPDEMIRRSRGGKS